VIGGEFRPGSPSEFYSDWIAAGACFSRFSPSSRGLSARSWAQIEDMDFTHKFALNGPA